MSQLSTIFGGIGINPEIVILDNLIRGQLFVLIFITHIDQVLGFIDGDFGVVRWKLDSDKLVKVTWSYVKLRKITSGYVRLRQVTLSYVKLRKVMWSYKKLCKLTQSKKSLPRIGVRHQSRNHRYFYRTRPWICQSPSHWSLRRLCLAEIEKAFKCWFWSINYFQRSISFVHIKISLYVASINCIFVQH